MNPLNIMQLYVHQWRFVAAVRCNDWYAGSPQGSDSTASYPGCVGSNLRETVPFWTWRDGNRVLLYGCILEGLHLYGCIFRGFSSVQVPRYGIL